MKKFNMLLILAFFAGIFFPSFGQITASENYYISHSTNEPWGHNSNLDAMTTAFGSGNWARLNFNDPDMATIFTSATHFIFIDGSASTDVNEQITFFINHRTALENWVAAGGRLLLNGGPDLPENLGFGSLSNEYYDNNAGNDVRPVTVVGPLLSQPFDLTHQTEYGGSFSHAKVSGDSLRPLILATHSDAIILADKPYGDGFLVFGGMTVSNFHTPQPAGSQILVNILHHAANSDITPAAPEAGFIATTLDSFVDNRVTLIDFSSGYSADRTWQISPATFEYADGSDEQSSKPVIRFRAAGQYSVTLSVKNGQGQDSETKENYITVQNRRNFYWVGGGGDWASAQHWATSSGGNEFYDEQPTKDDNVIFDANSFSADGQEVFLDNFIFELFNFTISGTTHVPEFTGGGHFYIYGTIAVSSPAIFSVGKLEFKSEEGTVIDLTNVTFGDNTGIEVDGPGTFDFVSPFVSNYFSPYKGNIYTHGHTITVNKFGADEGATAAIWFQNSELHAKRSFSMQPNNDAVPFKVDVNLFLGSSGSDAYLYLKEGFELNEVTLVGDIAIYNDMPAKKITFLPGTSANLYGNKLTAETFSIKGTEDEFITIQTGTLSKTSGTVVAEYVSIVDQTATGGAAFYADKNSIDHGENTGWIFSSKEVQHIAFADIPDKVYGTIFNLAATSSSGLAVAYDVASGPATISGNTITITGVGEVTVQAFQDGNDTYMPAQEKLQSFNVTKALQDLVFTVVTKTLGDAAFDVSATGGASGNPVVFAIVSGPASVTGNTVTLTGAGVVTIKASQEGNENYLAAVDVEQTFCVNPPKPVITVTGLDTGAPVLTATAAENYQWLNNGTAIPGATSNTHTVTEVGIYSVVTQAETCVSEASDGQILIITSVEGTPETFLQAYPNPVMNELIVDMTAFNARDEASVTLYDVSGKLMTRAKGRGTISILMQSYRPGPYAVVVSFGTRQITKHIIKK